MIPGIKKERIGEVIAIVGLEKVIDQKVGRYSLGMRQRIGIAQALLHKPSILILDEPTNGLDPAGIREIRQYIRKLADEENVAVVISSHLLSEIELMCDRIGVIKNGELVAIQEVNAAESNDTELRQVQMEVSANAKAIALLKETFDIEAVESGNFITLQTSKENIPNIIQTLVANDILIYQVEASRTTLEDKFFDLIGENVIG